MVETQVDLYDDSSLDRSPKKNWVEKRGGLPGPVRARARALMRENPTWTLSHAIAVAINAVKYSAATGDSKLPGKQNQRASKVAAHRGAAAKWERMKNLSVEEQMELDLSKTTIGKDSSKKDNKEVSTKEEAGNKFGAKSGGVTNDGKLAKVVAAYKRKKGSMTPEQRKKVEARIKSSKQQMGKKGVLN